MDEKLMNLLIQSLDQDLSPEDQKILDQGLQNSVELQLEKEQLLCFRKMILRTEISLGPDFSSDVMNRINDTKLSLRFMSQFKTIAYAGAASIILLLGSHLFTGGSLSLHSFLGIESVAADVLTYNVIGH